MWNSNVEVKTFLIRLTRSNGGKSELSPFLNVLSWQENTQCFVHCLELDIVTNGDTTKSAMDNLAELLVEQISFGEKNHIEIFHPAPREYWDKLYEIHTNKDGMHPHICSCLTKMM